MDYSIAAAKAYYQDIIGVVTLIVATYLILAYIHAKRANQKKLAKFNKLKPLTKNDKHALVFGAILIYHGCGDPLKMKPKVYIDSHKNWLKEIWGISNKEEATERINSLISLAQSEEFDADLSNPSRRTIEIQRKIAKELKLDLKKVQQTTSTFAWDTCRCVVLAKWCFWCGYISEQACWEYIHRAARIAQDLGADWQDYTISFLLGRAMHEFDPNDLDELEDLIRNAEQLLNGETLFDEQESLSIYARFPYKQSAA